METTQDGSNVEFALEVLRLAITKGNPSELVAKFVTLSDDDKVWWYTTAEHNIGGPALKFLRKHFGAGTVGALHNVIHKKE
jgi:hypothetical protein